MGTLDAMPLNVLATVSLPHRSGLVKDQVVNTFAFQGVSAGVGPTDDAILGNLNRFYGVAPTGTTVAVGALIGQSISRTEPPVLRLYDLDGFLSGLPHGSPYAVRNMNLLPAATSGSQPLPSEVAIAIGLYNIAGDASPEFGSGTRPRARHRGRIYIGPLIQNVSEQDPSEGYARVNDTGLNSLLNAAIKLRDETDTEWSIWSRANAALVNVDRVSVDRTFDTQRRRGETPTGRVSDTAVAT